MSEKQMQARDSLYNVWRLTGGNWKIVAESTPAYNRHMLVERFAGAKGMAHFGCIKVRKVA